jgi:8-oxo-dGTP pyrophosphatase MutT (NUDIX family)
MRDVTLCLLVHGKPPDTILLGFKKTGFGAFKYNGFGGKVEPGETIYQAAIRELAEETGIRISEDALQPVATLLFYFPTNPAWDQRVHVFMVEQWEGEAVEGIEMRPVWFRVDQIPYDQMWQDDRFWLPEVLSGKHVEGSITFAEDNETVAHMTMKALPAS